MAKKEESAEQITAQQEKMNRRTFLQQSVFLTNTLTEQFVLLFRTGTPLMKLNI